MQVQRQSEFRVRGLFLLLYWLGLMAVLLLLVGATYTWFSLSKTPRVNDMDLHVSSPAGLEIALRYDSAEEEWGQSLDFADMVDETSTLKPCTWSDEEQTFYAAAYGTDGRLHSISKRLTDAENANREGSEGYYTMGTFYARSDTTVQVSLSEAMTLEDGTECVGTYVIGTPVWNNQTILHDNGGSGAEYAIRVGIRVTPVNDAGETTGEPVFYIYEPNSDGHADGSTGYISTWSKDGAQSLVPEERLITQTTSTWREAYPVERDVTLREMGTFETKTELFRLEAGKLARIDLYLWLEGQDYDCTMAIGEAAQIVAHIQFASDYNEQSGLKPID